MIHRPTQSGQHGEQGAVALVAALSLAAMSGLAAMAIDLGALHASRRHLQAATDAAALAATYGLNGGATAASFASSILSRNSYPTNALSSAPIVTPGRYCPVQTSNPATRFTATSATDSVCPGDPNGTSFGIGPNAVQVTTSIQSPLHFGRLLIPGSTSEPITTIATASQINEAGFSAGTGVASLNMGLVNAVLSPLLGGSVNLNVVSYNGLVKTNVTALDFLNALATTVNLNAGTTYGGLLQSSVSIQNILSAALTALNKEGVVATIGADPYAGIAALQAAITGSPSIQLSQLLNLGVWQNQQIGSVNANSALNAGLNLYDLATLSALVANGQNAISIPPSNIAIPGVATVSIASTVVEPPQSPPFAFNPVGVTVHTAQVRLQLTLSLLNTGNLTALQLPIYVEAGAGTATLTGVSCGLDPKDDATATISAQSGLAYAYIGAVTANAMRNFSQEVTVTPAVLSNLGLIQVSGLAEAAIGSGSATSLTFTQTQIASQDVQTVSSTGMLSNLLQTLAPPLGSSLQVTLLGVPVLPGVAGPITGSVTTLLEPAFAAVDPLVDGILAALGVKLGYMDVTATGIRCGVPSLVL